VSASRNIIRDSMKACHLLELYFLYHLNLIIVLSSKILAAEHSDSTENLSHAKRARYFLQTIKFTFQYSEIGLSFNTYQQPLLEILCYNVSHLNKNRAQ
jgi:hypothetical protein